MCAMQRNFTPDPQLNQQLPQQQPEPQYRFRWGIFIGIPLVVIIFLWFIGGMDVAFSFFGIMRALGVIATNRYVLLACLGIACVTIILIMKVLRNKH